MRVEQPAPQSGVGSASAPARRRAGRARRPGDWRTPAADRPARLHRRGSRRAGTGPGPGLPVTDQSGWRSNRSCRARRGRTRPGSSGSANSVHGRGAIAVVDHPSRPQRPAGPGRPTIARPAWVDRRASPVDPQLARRPGAPRRRRPRGIRSPSRRRSSGCPRRPSIVVPRRCWASIAWRSNCGWA